MRARSLTLARPLTRPPRPPSPVGFSLPAPPVPRTLNKEWQEATNEKLLAQKSNPLTGISSAGYKGKGYVQ